MARPASLILAALVAAGLTGGAAGTGPRPDPPPPARAELLQTPEIRALGERLFFDRALSFNGTLSCAMCHLPNQGFASNQSARAIGAEGQSLRRNAPSLRDVALRKVLFHDGRETSLISQVWSPLLASDEMGNPSIGIVLDRLRADAVYGPAFLNAFPGRGATMETLGQAVAAFQASLRTPVSRFDRWRFGGEASALTEQEIRGYALFTGKAGCDACHRVGDRSASFTDDGWHNTGVAFIARPCGDDDRVEIAPGVRQRVQLHAIGLCAGTKVADTGRFAITGRPEDRWAFVTPSLRAVAETWPYMHDGSLATLDDVVAFYDRGGGANADLDARIRALGLSREEKAALVAFLRAL